METEGNTVATGGCFRGILAAMEQSDSRIKVAVRWALDLDIGYRIVLAAALIVMFLLILALCKLFGMEQQGFNDVMAAIVMVALIGAIGLVELLGRWAGTGEDEVGYWHPTTRRTTIIMIIGFSLALILAITISVYNVIGTRNAAEADRQKGRDRDEMAKWQAKPEVQAATENMERVREMRERAATRRATTQGVTPK